MINPRVGLRHKKYKRGMVEHDPIESYIQTKLAQAKGLQGDYHTEVNAKLQAEAMRLESVNFLTQEKVANAGATNDRQFLRPWELWKRHVLRDMAP